MKKIYILIIICLMGTMACENMEYPVFDDFDFKGVYFPHQLPLRTLSLGEDRVDNTLDKEFKFDIGVTIGGMYKNKWNWTVDYIVDNSLLNNAFTNAGDTLRALPASYYTLNPASTITIPKGDFNGRLRVQLTDAFFDDPLSLTGNYVIPLLITDTSADTILQGLAIEADPDKRVASDWEAGSEPKDWVLYGIKYINGYQGNYFQRGRDIRYQGGVPVDTIVYQTAHVERDRLVSLTSIGRNKAVSNFISINTSLTGEYAMELTFANMWGTPGGAITISPSAGALYEVTGSGQFFDKATSTESMLELRTQSMHLNYTYDDGTYVHQVSDVLVFRDRAIKFETNTINIIVPVP